MKSASVGHFSAHVPTIVICAETIQSNCLMNCDSAGNEKNWRTFRCTLGLPFYGCLAEKREHFS